MRRLDLARHGRRRGEGGTLSLELSIIAPLLLMIGVLFIAYGRYGQTTGLLEQGVRDSARSATQTRSEQDMATAIERVRQKTAAELPQSCGDSLKVSDVKLEGGGSTDAFARGTFVTVTYSCQLTMSDLLLPGWSDRTLTRSFTSRLDPNRGVYQ